ncbi:MAG: hypothetical protein JNL22_00465 [Bacteroidales bacterium]|nr:hypothetical protein [Bacteroidales bacterium]
MWQSVEPTLTVIPPTSPIRGIKGYSYKYDELNRLKKADFRENTQGTWAGTSKYNEEIESYDFNGNIKKLIRHGYLAPNNVAGEIDKLTYSYNGNKLVAVDDVVAGDNTGDFFDNGNYYTQSHTDEYLYDANGNLIKDVNKGIINISYNYLNQPTQLDKQTDTRLEYQYDAAGNKLRQTEIYKGVIQKTTDFVGNFVYVNGKPAWNTYDEGRVVYNTNGTFIMEASIKDHLGNIRIAFAPEGSLLKVRQVNSYYAFGMNIKELSKNGSNRVHPNEYLYNGKMMQDEQGLNWLDYGARFYDPVLGRWHAVDPLAEQRNWLSPYQYAQNSPIIRIDPNGMLDDGYTIDEDGYIERVDDTGGEDYDVLYKKSEYEAAKQSGEVNDFGNPEPDNNIIVNDMDLLPSLSQLTGFKNFYGHPESIAETGSVSNAFSVFKFASENSNAEWQIDGYKVGNNFRYVIATAHSGDDAVTTYGTMYGYNLKDQFFSMHSHPNTNEAASNGDQSVYSLKYWELNGGKVGPTYPANHYVYNVWQKTLYKYDAWKKDGLKRFINSSKDFYKSGL